MEQEYNTFNDSSDSNDETYTEEEKEILHNPDFGVTEQDRQIELKNAKLIALVYNIAGAVLMIGGVFFNLTAYWLPVLLLVYPIAGIFIIFFGKGLIRLETKKNSAYSNVSFGMLIASAGLIVNPVADSKLLNTDQLWVPSIIIGILMGGALYYVGIIKIHAPVKSQLFFVVLIALGYGYGSTLQINCGFDESQPQAYSATVVNHDITHGKHTSYYVTISEWGIDHSSEEVSVSNSFYNDEPIGSKVNVYLKKGVLNIPWFYITR